MATDYNRADDFLFSQQQESTSSANKYGGLVPKKKPLISKDYKRAFFDSADWALHKQEASIDQRTIAAIENLRPKLQRTPRKQLPLEDLPVQLDMRILLSRVFRVQRTVFDVEMEVIGLVVSLTHMFHVSHKNVYAVMHNCSIFSLLVLKMLVVSIKCADNCCCVLSFIV